MSGKITTEAFRDSEERMRQTRETNTKSKRTRRRRETGENEREKQGETDNEIIRARQTGEQTEPNE